MENSVNNNEVEKLIDAILMKQILNKKDCYGENMLEKTVKKLRFVNKIANTFNFDTIMANIIMILYDISKSCYGDIVEDFFKDISPKISRIGYVNAIVKNVLNDESTQNMEAIYNSLKNVISGNYETPEEQIVDIVNYGFEFSDSIEDEKNRIIMMSNYMEEVIQKSIENRALAAIAIPINNIKKRDICITENKDKLLERYEYYFNNYNLISENFKENLKGLSREEITAYYITMR